MYLYAPIAQRQWIRKGWRLSIFLGNKTFWLSSYRREFQTLKIWYLCKHSSKLFGKKSSGRFWKFIATIISSLALIPNLGSYWIFLSDDYGNRISDAGWVHKMLSSTASLSQKQKCKETTKEAAVQRLCQQALLAFLISINTEEHYHIDVLFLFSPLT